MDGHNNHPTDDLEGRLRKMILHSSGLSPQTVPESPSPSNNPTVKLPQQTSFHDHPVPQDPRLYHRNSHLERNPHQHLGPGDNYGGVLQDAGAEASSSNRGFDHPHNHGLRPHQGLPEGAHWSRTSANRGRGLFQQNRDQRRHIHPDVFQRGGQMQSNPAHQNHARPQLFDPRTHHHPPVVSREFHLRSSQYLDQIAAREVSRVEMGEAEYAEKHAFRAVLQNAIFDVCDADPERLPRVSLECFGSFQSGFATQGSDMDLVIVLQDRQRTPACFSLLEDDLPRALERHLLRLGYGARLLTRTRVPIIKICERPHTSLLDRLRAERERWDGLPNERKYPHLHPEENEGDVEVNNEERVRSGEHDQRTIPAVSAGAPTPAVEAAGMSHARVNSSREPSDGAPVEGSTANYNGSEAVASLPGQDHPHEGRPQPQDREQRERVWSREKQAGPLDFPKSGVGIQSDINFFNPLGLHNTQMLRCYSLCDPRVRPIVLFVKAWAKRRKINSSYSGTLSSYGYVLMVIHYLVNIASPPVLPNLHLAWRPNAHCTPAGATRTEVDGWTVDFWRNDDEILSAARSRQLTSNVEPVGSLLVGFFHYFSSQGGQPQFTWMRDVLSLRVPGGLQLKEAKGWTKAITEEGDGKRVQHRYLFCIEDPFELNHNVARTVTHKGIVAIRDEFRRAKRILQAVGNGVLPHDGELLADLVEVDDLRKATLELSHHSIAPNDGSGGIGPFHQAQEGWQASLETQFHQSAKHSINPADGRHHASIPPRTTQLDMTDPAAFPSLGPTQPGPSTVKSPHPKTAKVPNEADKRRTASPKSHHAPRASKPKAEGGSSNFHEISGDRAKQYLEEVKRKKLEEQAEVTATGAAEAVLGDD